MPQYEMKVSPEVGFDEEQLVSFLKAKKWLSDGQYHRIVRRSVDARQKNVKVNLLVEILSAPAEVEFVEYFERDYDVRNADPVIIVGAGPAGLFAALKAIEGGLNPIVLERGKDVRSRRRDLAAINKDHVVNPESNYCFGEGGAGTYSDGKLYTRSKKRGSVRRIFEILVAHGATEEILYESHPHIGTNKLPKLVTALRESIERAGGQVKFDSKVIDFIIEDGEMKGVKLDNGEYLKGVAVLLATGHSARDIFRLCRERKIKIEAKPFALGVRIEHPQQVIDSIQYHCEDRGPYLPASSYALVSQTNFQNVERGVFSFCMCPGGFIVPAATSPGELVVNGMSPSRRDSRFANSGMVAAVELEDIKEFQKYGELAAMEFQAEVEKRAWTMGGQSQVAPAQRMIDFVNGKTSRDLLETSYQPGLTSVDMREVLPEFITSRLRQAFKIFGKRMKGYLSNDAQLIGVESRTSSPVRIPRDKMTFEHIEVKRLFPCGEGAGYAGGIASAAMDGEKCMEKIIAMYAK
ncbi:NAD(P)/FAD-dependent oxidoreductase [Marinoscillum sp. MHG1-6]|uniref:NAD(P)/FAD-dependent oxidoreductase n=1 Tax=Marinoscillum sp. MHG1-6 TaxID=2959627 RepID=UPI002157E61E|nr:FAD-binding protein [Marinoscillum sp. MHG1-6]